MHMEYCTLIRIGLKKKKKQLKNFETRNLYESLVLDLPQGINHKLRGGLDCCAAVDWRWCGPGGLTGWSNPHRWVSSTCLLDFHELPEIFFSLLEVLDDPINVWFRCHLASSTFEDSSTAWWLMFQVSLQIFMLSNQLLVSYSAFEMLTFSWDFIHLITLSNLLDCIENAIIKIASYISILCPN